MIVQDYRCPQCKSRLIRMLKWHGYCCESCRLAVTLIGAEKIRLTPMAGTEPTILSLSELSA